MFFSQIVLAKRGPLAKVWLAGHWDKKLTKRHIFKTNIPKSIKHILNPHLPMALRMTSHLLLGVVRIFSKKVKFLLDDCGDAVARFKGAAKLPAPGITLQVVEEDEDPQTLATTSKPLNIAQQIDDYLRGVDRIEDLVVDRFFESKNFQQLYLDTMAAAAAKEYTPVKAKKSGAVVPTTPTTPGQETIVSEAEEESPQHVDTLKQQRLDRDIEAELERLEAERKEKEEKDESISLPGQPPKGQEDSFMSYKEWIENFHEDEMVIRGAHRASIHVTPQRPSIDRESGGEGGKKKLSGDDLSPIRDDIIFDQISPQPSPFKTPMKEVDIMETEITSPGLQPVPDTNLADVFDPTEYYDELMRNEDQPVAWEQGAEFPEVDRDDQFDNIGGGGFEAELPEIQDIVQAPLTSDKEASDKEKEEQEKEKEKEATESSGPDSAKKALPFIPLVGPTTVSSQTRSTQPRAETSIRRRRQKNKQIDLQRLKNQSNLLLSPHRVLPSTNKEFQLSIDLLKSPGPKYSLLLPIRKKMNEKIVQYFRDIFQHKYPNVLTDEDVKLMNYVKSLKIHNSMKEFSGHGTEFDSTMKEGLGLPADHEFEDAPLKEQIILSKVTERIENDQSISPTKRRKFDTTLTEEEESKLLADLDKELEAMKSIAITTTTEDVGANAEDISEYKQPQSPIGDIDTHFDFPGGDEGFNFNDDVQPPDLSPIQHQQQPEEEESIFKTPQSSKKSPGPGTWTPRTATMHNVLNNYFNKTKATTIQFNSIVPDPQNRVAVAGTFYEMLVLKTKGLVQVKQDKPYDDILITKTDQFHQTRTWAKQVESSFE